MLKRSLSVLLSLLMVMSLVMVPAMSVSANVEQIDITDYTPNLNDNFITGAVSRVDTGKYGLNAASLGGNIYSVTADAAQTVTPPKAAQEPTFGLQYYTCNLKKNTPYVVMLQAKKANNSDVIPNLIYGLTSETAAGYNPETGSSTGTGTWMAQWVYSQDITSTDYQKVGTVLTLAHDGYQTGSTYTRLKVGLGIGNTYASYTKNDETKKAFEFRGGSSVNVDWSKTYIGPERAYDVIHELSATEALPGSVITANAKVVNQLGSVSTLDQTFTMNATDVDGNVVPNTEIAVSTPDANGDYTITVGNGANGEYVILARSSYKDGEAYIQSAIPLSVESIDYSDADAVPGGFVDYITANGTDKGDWGVSAATSDGMVTFTSAANQDGKTLTTGQDRPCDGWYWTVDYTGESAANDEWLVRFKVKKVSDSVNPTVIYGMSHAAAGSGGNWQKNKRVYTQELTDSDWHVVEQTFTLPTDGHASRITFELGLGFGNTTFTALSVGDAYKFVPNSAIMVDLDSIYVGKSSAQNSVKAITNTAPITKVFAGKSISAQAEVINAFGDKGTLDQTIDVAILDAATRTQPVSGITVTKGENGSYTINVGDSVAEGTYVAVASNATNGAIVRRGLEFTVETIDKYTTDHVATYINTNMDLTIDASPGATGAFGITSENSVATGGHYRITAAETRTDAQLPGDNWERPMNGARWKNAAADISKGTTYVLKIKVRNVNEEVTPNVVFGLMTGTKNWTSQYVWSETLADTEWHEIKKTFTFNHDAKVSDVLIGLGTGSTYSAYNGKPEFAYIPGASIDVNDETYYFAPEAAYDVELTPSVNSTRAGATVTVDASVINQVGDEGTLNQNFTWAPLNAAKTALADGITITPVNGDSTKVNVAFDNDVENGTYVIAAYSEDYEMAKSVVITISDKVSVENVVVDTTEKTVSFDALNVAEEGFTGAVYVAEYVPVSETFVKAEKIPFTLTAGNTKDKEIEYTLVPDEANEIRVYIWDNNLTPYIQPILKKNN